VERFPALTLARHAGEAGQTYPTVLSAADEVGVEAFVAGRIPFLGIAEVVERTLTEHLPVAVEDVETIFAADAWARRIGGKHAASLAP
jgi:1-deoxy-D-xylulose-5-phosphate reductoisomerase